MMRVLRVPFVSARALHCPPLLIAEWRHLLLAPSCASELPMSRSIALIRLTIAEAAPAARARPCTAGAGVLLSSGGPFVLQPEPLFPSPVRVRWDRPWCPWSAPLSLSLSLSLSHSPALRRALSRSGAGRSRSPQALPWPWHEQSERIHHHLLYAIQKHQGAAEPYTIPPKR